MDFRRRAQRAGKHVSRFFSKPFVGANKTNLKALDTALEKVRPGINRKTFQVSLVRYGQFDFSWLLLLTDDEIVDLRGEWAACFQTSQRSSRNTRFAQTVNPGDRRKMFASNDSTFWDALQDVKTRYKAIAADRMSGFFKDAVKWIRSKTAKVEDWANQNRYFGQYMAGYNTVNAVFDDATERGAESDLDRKILAAGGLWRIVKAGISAGKSIAKLVTTADPSAAYNVVKKGVSILNHLGGLLAGLTDLVQNKEADFRKLSSRFGLDQHISVLQKKYLGKGVIGRDDTLLKQTLEGPQRLEKAATITMVDLEKVRKDFRHAQWWCQVWRKDIEEMKKDIDEADYIKHLRQIFGRVASDQGIVKPSQIAEMSAYVETNRKAMRKQVETLESKVRMFDALIGSRLRRLDVLLAAYETRRSLASQQKKTAGLGLAYDTKRKIAHEISSFDRSKLRSHKLPRKDQRQRVEETDPNDIRALVTKAMADRRQYIAPDEDEEEDEIEI